MKGSKDVEGHSNAPGANVHVEHRIYARFPGAPSGEVSASRRLLALKHAGGAGSTIRTRKCRAR